jgi:4-methyl-5(b-hydroxyethyl)-thiazole monophosphate biosynthesis
MPNIITILAPGFEETEAVTFIDLLRRAKVGVTILGLASRTVTGSHDITLTADALLTEFSGPFDGIVLPGGMPGTKNLAQSARVLELVRESFQRGNLCAAICAAPMVLGRAGILKGMKATCYPGFEQELAGATVVEDAVVRDRTIITSRGLGTAVEFGLELIAYLSGPEAAEKVRESVLYSG